MSALVALAVLGASACGTGSLNSESGASGTRSSGAGGSDGADGAAGASGADGLAGADGAAGASGHGGSGGSLPPSDYCTVCQNPEASGSLENGEINEASGLMASADHPGIFFVHNDSGDSPRFFAIDVAGADMGTYNVSGASARDWEDAARGPCNGGSCLLFGDVGDNSAQRSEYAVYRVPEPTNVEPGTHSLAAESFPFVYPDGSHNCETLLVHPTTGEMVVVTKVRDGTSGIYRFPTPLSPGQTATLIKLGSVRPPEGSTAFTSGDVHPSGHGVALRTYSRLFFYPMAPDETIADALATTPCEISIASEDQGETVAWTSTGDAHVTISEGAASEVNLASCE